MLFIGNLKKIKMFSCDFDRCAQRCMAQKIKAEKPNRENKIKIKSNKMKYEHITDLSIFIYFLLFCACYVSVDCALFEFFHNLYSFSILYSFGMFTWYDVCWSELDVFQIYVHVDSNTDDGSFPLLAFIILFILFIYLSFWEFFNIK